MVPRPFFAIPLPNRAPLELGARTLVMGILNVTPDSFADGGAHFDFDRAVAAGVQMAAAGADILDIGGESTRPGAEPVTADVELSRVLPVLRELRSRIKIPISIDTYKAVVAREAVAAGATMINDISGLQHDPELGSVAAETGAALVLMHMRGRSKDMYAQATYDDAPEEVASELSAAVGRATAAGVSAESIVLDPGIGFAKRAEHSYALLAHLEEVASLQRPILCGPSRKSFLTKAIGERAPIEREWATAAAITACVLGGAHIVRVHGVRAMLDVVRVADMIRAAH
jgi:dihydropteroate synthase